MHPIFLAAGFAFMFFAPCVLAIRTDVKGGQDS
jgi:hypothetical protein